MMLFAYGLDPYLERLCNGLQGVVVHAEHVPVLGPALLDELAPPPLLVEERYTCIGYADDVKPWISCMQEFIFVDDETRIFEAASGCELHRDPQSNKVKFLPLGRWQGTLRQEDIPAQCNYVTLTDHLDMLGLPLFATSRKTIKYSGDDLQSRIKNMV